MKSEIVSEDYNYLFNDENINEEDNLEHVEFNKIIEKQKKRDEITEEMNSENEEMNSENEEINSENEEINSENEDNENEEINSDNEDNENNKDYKQYGGMNDYEPNEELIKDHPLINKDNIIKRVRLLIQNYFSKEYQDYKNGFMTKKIFSKLSKKTRIVREKGFIYLKKIKDEDTKSYLFKIKQPTYLYLKDENKKVNDDIKNQKYELDNIFMKLQKTSKKSESEINLFNSYKKNYIKLLEDKEVLNLYYITINKISNENVKKISYSIKDIDIEKNMNLFIKKSFSFDIEEINELNNLQITKLNEYNDIIQNLNDNKNKINKKIKEYIEKYDVFNQNINNELKNKLKNINKLVNNQSDYIDYIVENIPKMY